MSVVYTEITLKNMMDVGDAMRGTHVMPDTEKS
jgi:hypothetical protein